MLHVITSLVVLQSLSLSLSLVFSLLLSYDTSSCCHGDRSSLVSPVRANVSQQTTSPHTPWWFFLSCAVVQLTCDWVTAVDFVQRCSYSQSWSCVWLSWDVNFHGMEILSYWILLNVIEYYLRLLGFFIDFSSMLTREVLFVGCKNVFLALAKPRLW